MGVGMPEYVRLFCKPQTDKTRSYGDEPVTKTKTGDGSYSRAAWQVDAHALVGVATARTAADFPPMLTQDEINGMDGSQLYNYCADRMQKGTPYNHAVARALLRDDRRLIACDVQRLCRCGCQIG